MEVARGKRIEKIYIGIACLLVIIFVMSFFWTKITDYYKNITTEPASNVTQFVTKVGDDIFFNSIYFNDVTSLCKYNTKTKKLDPINYSGVLNLKYSNGYIYYLDYERCLYRYSIKDNKNELILRNCIEFQINNNKIVFKDSEEQIISIYDIKTKQISKLGINTFMYLLLENKIYYINYGTKSVMEYDIETKQYKVYPIDLQDQDAANITFYKGKFYISDFKNMITCYDKDFRYIWRSDGGYNLTIVKGRIYFSNSKDGMNLYSINLNGQDLKKESSNSNFLSGEFLFSKELDKNVIKNIKENKTYEIPNIEPVILNIPSKKEIKTILGCRMVKKGDKLYYPSYKGINEYDLKSSQTKLILYSNYAENLIPLRGNIAISNQIFKYIDETNQIKQITNMLVYKVITHKDDIYVYSSNYFLYKLDFETNSIKKVFENQVFIQCYYDNKIYYSNMQNHVIDITNLNLYDLETGENRKIEYSQSITKPMNDIIYIDDNVFMFTSDDGLYIFNIKDKSINQIYNQPIYKYDGVLITNNGILFLADDHKKLYLLDLKTNKIKNILAISKNEDLIESYLYDHEEKLIYYLSYPYDGQIKEIRLK